VHRVGGMKFVVDRVALRQTVFEPCGIPLPVSITKMKKINLHLSLMAGTIRTCDKVNM
jgi:hypothetical protein